MPRNISGFYSLPPVYLAIPGTTIVAVQHNTPLEDIADTFNYPQPIQYGGTNAATAVAGNDNLTTTSSNLPAAALVNMALATGVNVLISGAGATITSFGTVQSGAHRYFQFDGINTLTHNGTSLILPGAANITTAAGDSGVAVSLGSGNWTVAQYQRANGSIIAGFPNGSAGAPSVYFASDTNTGLYRISSDTIGISVGGVLGATVSTAALTSAVQLIGLGTQTNNDAAAGYIGEVVRGAGGTGFGSLIPLASATPLNIETINLVPGDWDVYCTFRFSADATANYTVRAGSISASNTSLDVSVGGAVVQQRNAGFVAGAHTTYITVGPVRKSLNNATPFFMVASATFSAGAMSAECSVYARRMR